MDRMIDIPFPCRECRKELHLQDPDCIIQRNKVICRSCYNKKQHRPTKKSSDPKRNTTQFLGIHVAENLLSRVFKDVQRMPYHHPFDVICNHGKMIDIKSSSTYNWGCDGWIFTIDGNKIPDYFLCIAFDNIDDLNPLHLWMIPSKTINKSKLHISESTLHKWSQYELALDRVNECCDIMKVE